MFNYRTLITVPIFFLAMTLDVSADNFYCSRQLAGVTGRIVEINRYMILDDIEPSTVGLPTQFLVDFESKTLIPSKGSRVSRSVSFNGVDQVENKLVIQGIDEGIEGVIDGVAWSLVISKSDGKSVLSVAGDGVAYAVFGVCKPTKDRK